MEVIAKSKYVRMSPKKVRLVAAVVRNLPVNMAEVLLTKLNKKAARPLLLTLKQGKANAMKNFGLREETLVIKKLEIGKGPSYKRGRPVARGQMHPILKRTCHINLVLEGLEKPKEEKVGESKIKKEGKVKKNGPKS